MTAPMRRSRASDQLTRAMADIEATIALWQNTGVTAREIAQQLGCRRSWGAVRFKMLSISMGYGKRAHRHTVEKRFPLTQREREKLAKARIALRVPQSKLAARLKISESSLRDYETGRRAPLASTAASWWRMLKVAA